MPADAMMELLDNITRTVKDGMADDLGRGGRLSVVAACFSIYAYHELKRQLEGLEELRFIFSAPAFTKERHAKGESAGFLARLERERGLTGTVFEQRLKNTLSQKAIAHECAEWIRRKAVFKANISGENMGGFAVAQAAGAAHAYMPLADCTTTGLGCNRGGNAYNMVAKMAAPHSEEMLRLFDQLWADGGKLEDVTAGALAALAEAYRENAPEYIYFVALYNIFGEFLRGLTEDDLPDEATGFRQSAIWGMLYNFQKDAALAAINKLERYNGCILADSVGLGKTFTALAVIKYYENRNKSVLVLCPRKLSDNWTTYKGNYLNNPIAADRLNYDVLCHSDLSRERGQSNGLDLARLNWGNYDLVVIDESHNFRNGGVSADEDKGGKENRYDRLMNRIIRAGVKTKVLMLSATPVNTRFYDLRNQLRLAYEGRPELIDDKLGAESSIDRIFREAQSAFNRWSKFPPGQRTTAALLRLLDFDFFTVLDCVTIARSRRHIRKHYDTSGIGPFPLRLKPLSLRPCLTDLRGLADYDRIYALLMRLKLGVYMPTAYVFDSRLDKYNAKGSHRNIDRRGRELGIRRLMGINLLKRLESSVHAFRLTVERIAALIEQAIARIDAHEAQAEGAWPDAAPDFADLDGDDQELLASDAAEPGQIDLKDMDYRSWRRDLAADLEILDELKALTEPITPEHDAKLQALLGAVARQKIEHPLNGENKKLLIFTAFADTAEYLYDNLSRFALDGYGLHSALVTGGANGAKTTAPLRRADLNAVLTCFSPIAKERGLLMPNGGPDIDILIATDCISEGQNLQDCDCCVNYDIHWNPVRIIQRFGRIDRLGSRNRHIRLVNFWPNVSLDDYIKLKARVETRMKISILTGSGDEDPINVEEQGDLEYRRAQLERLQEEAVDLEDLSGGVSIMDLGLNEFRLELLEYLKAHPELERAPLGIHAVVPASAEAPPGMFCVLKYTGDGPAPDRQNRLHPYYLAYIGEDGRPILGHQSPKALLDALRLLCLGCDEPDMALCDRINRETKDGRDMRKYTALLESAVASIITTKEERDIDSLFSPGGTTALSGKIGGLDDFALVCFLIVAKS